MRCLQSNCRTPCLPDTLWLGSSCTLSTEDSCTPARAMHSRNQRRNGSPVVPLRSKAPLARGTISLSQPKPFRVPKDGAHSPFSRGPYTVYPPRGARGRPCVSVPVVSLEKIPCLGRSEGAPIRLNCTSSTSSSSSSSSSSGSAGAMLKPPHKPLERVLNGRLPSMTPSGPERRPAASPSGPDRRPSSSPSTVDKRPSSSPSLSPSSVDRPPTAPPTILDKKQQNGTKGSRPYKRISGRIFDPNKHCGVLDPESKRPCTRSLTCKTHSLTHRRAVPGRKKLFDSLLAEHKGRMKEKEREKEAQSAREQQQSREANHSLPAQSHDPLCGTPTNGRNGKTLSPVKARLLAAYMARTPRSRGGVGQNFHPGPAPDAAPANLRAETAIRLSSDEDEVAVPDESERPDWPYSARHPQPMGCCSFGCRLIGQGHYVFDRRWDRMRRVLHRMVERHVTSLMWRKIPSADENPAPSPSTQSSLGPSSGGSSGIGLPLLSPPTAFVSQSDGVSMVSYSATFPPSSGGIFSIVDSSSLVAPFPALSAGLSQGGRPRAKPGQPRKVGGAGGGGEGGVSGGKRKRPLLSFVAPHKKNNVTSIPPHLAGPAHCSNGRSPLGAKTEPSSPRDSDFAAPRPPPADHAPSAHSPLPFSATYGRKRKGCNPSGSPSKAGKAAGLSSIFRKSVSDPPHPSVTRQPAVHR
ncbi:hypothetical protein GJAV_G00159230 [Gymnothorax javanicus]|nr:hypothetical protein GJAV_G00159230 [Gymnothorax javanicus]